MNAEAYGNLEEGAETEPATATAAEPDDTVEQLPLDVTFEILKNRRRRLVLAYLREAEDTVTIGELAEHIAAIENDTTVQQLNAQQRKRVYIGLYQCHLPKMDDASVVAFNQSRGLVDLEPTASALYAYLDVETTTEEQSRPLYYTALVLAAGVLFFAANALSAPLIASGVILLFLGAVVTITMVDEWPTL